MTNSQRPNWGKVCCGSEYARRQIGQGARLDQLFDMNELQRSQARAEMGDEPAQFLFLVGLFTSSASIPIAPSLTVLQSEHRILPAAFYAVLRHSLWKWMYVYDYEAAAHCAEMGLIDMEESELADSIYPQVAASVPDCLRNRLSMNPHRGLAFVKALQPQVRGVRHANSSRNFSTYRSVEAATATPGQDVW